MTTKGNSNKPRVNMPRPSFMWVYGILGALIIGWALFDQSDDTPLPSDWSTVGQMVEAGEVEKIEIFNRDQARGYLTKEAVEKYRTDPDDKRFHRMPARGVQLVFTIGSVDSFREDLRDAEQQSGQQVPVVYENKTNDWTNILVNLLPWVLIIGVWIFLMRSMARGAGGGAGGGIMNVGKAKAQVFDKDNSKRVTFKDVAGLEEAKVEIMEIVDFLKKSDKYKELGAKIPKGALLVGPPGTGKTLLAKAVAGEANVPFLSISGSDFVEMFVGVGASRVRDLFEQAKQKAPCILFIDEIFILHVVARLDRAETAHPIGGFSVVDCRVPAGSVGNGYVFLTVRQRSEEYVVNCQLDRICECEVAGADLCQLGGLLLAVQRVGHGETGGQGGLRSLNGRRGIFRALRSGKHGFGLRRRGERDHAEQQNCRKQER